MEHSPWLKFDESMLALGIRGNKRVIRPCPKSLLDSTNNIAHILKTIYSSVEYLNKYAPMVEKLSFVQQREQSHETKRHNTYGHLLALKCCSP